MSIIHDISDETKNCNEKQLNLGVHGIVEREESGTSTLPSSLPGNDAMNFYFN